MNKENINLNREAIFNTLELKKLMKKELADLLIVQAGGWENICHEAASVHNVCTSEIKGFSDSDNEALIKLYSDNKHLFLKFIEDEANRSGEKNLVAWASSQKHYGQAKAVDNYAYALYDPLNAVKNLKISEREFFIESLLFVCRYSLFQLIKAVNRSASRVEGVGFITVFLNQIGVTDIKIDAFLINKEDPEVELLTKNLTDKDLDPKERLSLVSSSLAKEAIKILSVEDEKVLQLLRGEVDVSEILKLKTIGFLHEFVIDNKSDINDFLAKTAISKGLNSNIDTVKNMLSADLHGFTFDEVAKGLYAAQAPKEHLNDMECSIIKGILLSIYKEIINSYAVLNKK